MKRTIFVLLALSSTAAAGTIPLTPYSTQGYTLQVPRGWKIDVKGTTLYAQQDPSHPLAASLVLVVDQNRSNASEDAIIDQLVAGTGVTMKATKRGALPTGHGHFARFDATPLDVEVVVVAESGVLMGCVLLAKPDEIDKLGGFELITTIMGSLHRDAA